MIHRDSVIDILLRLPNSAVTSFCQFCTRLLIMLLSCLCRKYLLRHLDVEIYLLYHLIKTSLYGFIKLKNTRMFIITKFELSIPLFKSQDNKINVVMK